MGVSGAFWFRGALINMPTGKAESKVAVAAFFEQRHDHHHPLPFPWFKRQTLAFVQSPFPLANDHSPLV